MRGELHCVGSEHICDGKADCLADEVIHMSDEHGCREYLFQLATVKSDSHRMRLNAYACVCVEKRIRMRKTTQRCEFLSVNGVERRALCQNTHAYAENACA